MHQRFLIPCLLGFLSTVGSPGGFGAGANAAAEPKDAAVEIQKLIDDLDSTQFEVREKATAKLLALEEKALPALREAARARPGLEKLRRVESIIVRTEQMLLERQIAKLLGQVNEGGIDQFIDLMVERKGFARDQSWEAAYRLAQAMVKRAEQVGGQNLPKLGDQFLKLPVAAGGPERNYNSESRFLVSAVDHVNVVHDCFLMSSGPVKNLNSTRNSILLVNGDISDWNGTNGCVIFCNGNIKGLNGTSDCVIFCTGNVEHLNSISNCVLFATGEFKRGNSTRANIFHVKAVQTNYSGMNQYIGLKEVKANLSDGDTFSAAEHAPLHPLKLFDLGRLGIELAAAGNAVTVAKIADGKRFAKAGVRPGDRITAIDGKEIATVADANRLLRRKLPDDPAVLRIRRGDQALEVAVTW